MIGKTMSLDWSMFDWINKIEKEICVWEQLTFLSLISIINLMSSKETVQQPHFNAVCFAEISDCILRTHVFTWTVYWNLPNSPVKIHQWYWIFKANSFGSNILSWNKSDDNLSMIEMVIYFRNHYYIIKLLSHVL